MKTLADEIARARARHEAALMPEVERILRRQASRVASYVERGMIEAAEAEAADPAVAHEIILTVWMAVAPGFASATYDGIGRKALPDDVWYQLVLMFVETEGAVMVVAVSEATKEAIRQVVQKGLDDGQGMREIARHIRRDMPEFSTVRAERIVRSEVISASNYGSQIGAERFAEDSGVTLEKEWVATFDHRTRDSHADLNGTRVGINEDFDVDGYPAAYPGDPRLPAKSRIQCRCTVVHVPVAARRSWRDERDARIRKSYPALRDSMGAVQAWDELGEREGLSARHIRRIVYDGTRNGTQNG